MSERQPVVKVDQVRARRCEGVFAAELLPSPFELLVAELAGFSHAGKAEVRRLRQDHGVEQARHVRRAAPVARQQDEVLGEAGPAVNLDQELGQVDLRQPGLDQLSQPPGVRVLGGVDDQVAVREPSLGGLVAFIFEAL